MIRARRRLYWSYTIQYNTTNDKTIQYNEIQYNTIPYNTIQYNTIQYNTIQYNTIQYNTIQYITIQYEYEYYYSDINPVEFRGHVTWSCDVCSKCKDKKCKWGSYTACKNN